MVLTAVLPLRIPMYTLSALPVPMAKILYLRLSCQLGKACVILLRSLRQHTA